MGMNGPDDQAFANLVNLLQQAFTDNLVSIILFGSAAEGRQRAVSDTNVVVVVRQFTPEGATAAQESLALARVALRLRLMVLCEDELTAAASAFAVKFADILRRRRVLFGRDSFADLAIPRPAAIAQLRQSLLNQVMRLREQWLNAPNDGALAMAGAESAGGMRACAAELLALEGTPAATPREALERIAGGPVAGLQEAREGRSVAGAGTSLLTTLLGWAEAMRRRAEQLS